MSKELIVIIDDERTFVHDNRDAEYIYLRSGIEAIGWLGHWWAKNQNVANVYQEQDIDQLWFDHDLGPGLTGLDVAQFLFTLHIRTDNMLPIYDIFVHSQNPVGADNIMKMLAGVPGNAFRCPLPELSDLAGSQS